MCRVASTNFLKVSKESAVVSFAYGIPATLFLAGLCYALDWTYVNVTTQAGDLGREQGSIFADFKRWAASMPTIPLFSHGPEQRATQLTSTYEMSKLGGRGNLETLFSRMVGNNTTDIISFLISFFQVQSRHRLSTEESTPSDSEEKERLLSEPDCAV